MVDKVLWLMGS